MRNNRSSIWKVLFAALVLPLILPAIAAAHEIEVQITCPPKFGAPATATFKATYFPSGNNLVKLKGYVDDVEKASKDATASGNTIDPSTLAIPSPNDYNEHVYMAKASWSAPPGCRKAAAGEGTSPTRCTTRPCGSSPRHAVRPSPASSAG